MIRKAETSEYAGIMQFYWKMIDDMKDKPHHPKWQKGIYPADEDVREAVEKGEMYIDVLGGEIAAAMRVNHEVTDGYEKAPWSIAAAPDEVTVIHMLGVAVPLQGQGIASEMVRFVFGKAKSEGQKSVRLDVLKGHVPALRLYESLGFKSVGEIELFYEDTGLTAFVLYEYNLQ